jgi:hypothetical protein
VFVGDLPISFYTDFLVGLFPVYEVAFCIGFSIFGFGSIAYKLSVCLKAFEGDLVSASRDRMC